MTAEKVDQVEVLNVVVADTQSLTVRNEEAAELIAVLRPIVERFSAYAADADALTISNDVQAKLGAALEAACKRDKAIISDAFAQFAGGLIARLDKTHRGWTGFRGWCEKQLSGPAQVARDKVLAWQESERRKAEAERARLQAIEDERARREQERLAKLAESRKTPEVQEKYREAAAAVTPVVVQVQAPVAAVKARRVWRIAAVDLPTFCAAVARDTGLAGYIEIRATALERAKAANPLLTVPGVTFAQYMV